jgi:DNA-binding response OmpR family regulator
MGGGLEAKKSVLIIEDEAGLREAATARLTQEGFNVLTATDGASGLSSALSNKPDVILLDIKMPNMNGFQMLKKLRAEGGWGATVKVIFLTNLEMGSQEESADIEALEPTHYLIKNNTSLDELTTKVKDVLA